MPVGLVRWLICGLSGAVACLLAVLLIARPPYDSRLLLFPAFGFVWAMVAGAMARRLRHDLLAPVVLAGAVVGGVGNHYLPPLLLTGLRGQPWPLIEIYPNSVALGASAGFFGALVGTLLWWPGDRTRRWNWVIIDVAVVVAVLLLWPPWSPLLRQGAEKSRQISCLSDLKQLGLATLMYTQDYDGHLPPAATTNDLSGVDYAKIPEAMRHRGPRACQGVLGGGMLWPYAKSGRPFICPSDPWTHDCFDDAIPDRFIKVGQSFTWNPTVAGKPLASLPLDTWIFHDREPWHFHGWNVAFLDGSARWCATIPSPRR